MKPFSTTLTVRVGDINYGGHLGHDRLITLLHQARLDFLKHFAADELNCFGVGLIMQRLQVDFRGEAFLGDELTVAMHVGQCRPSRFTLHYQVDCENRPIARAETTMVAFDYESRRAVALPDALMAAFGERQ